MRANSHRHPDLVTVASDHMTTELPRLPADLNKGPGPEFSKMPLVRCRSSQALVVATCGSLVIFGFGSFLPIWTAWSIGSWCGCGSSGFLWQALARFPDN